MSPEVQRIILQHVVGFVGVITNTVLAVSSFKALKDARAKETLGGLDTRSWPLFFGCNLIWLTYSVRLGDVWLFLCTLPAILIWLSFNLSAIALLSFEAGEFVQASEQTWQQTYLDNHTVDWTKTCKMHRPKMIAKLNSEILWSVGTACSLSYCCSRWNIPGLEFIDDDRTLEVKRLVFMVVSGISSLLCFGSPITRICTFIRRRDASAVLIPFTLAQMFSNSVWAAYGFFLLDPALIIPNSVGCILCVVQLILKVLFYESGSSVAAGPEIPMRGVDVVLQKYSPDAPDKQFEANSGVTVDCNIGLKPTDGILSCNSITPGAVLAQNNPDTNKVCGIFEDYLVWQAAYQRWKSNAKSVHTNTDLPETFARQSSLQQLETSSAFEV